MCPMTYISVIGFIALGLVNSLIVEHFTIYNFCLAVFMILYTFVPKKRSDCRNWDIWPELSAESRLMFSNSTYRQVSSGDDFYRGVNTSNLAINCSKPFWKDHQYLLSGASAHCYFNYGGYFPDMEGARKELDGTLPENR